MSSTDLQAKQDRPSNAEAIILQREANAVATFRPPRLPYHPAIEERFGIDQASWRALVEAIFPLATTVDSVILALSYCRARKLDPFKKPVYIVPIWSKADGKMIDTVWPGIGELRTTAFRTKLYAGRDDAEFGPDVTKKVGNINVTFPEWCKITVYRMCDGERRAFAGPKVYWLETYAPRGRNDVSPNEMWAKRCRGQLEKCAEAAALRAAFPEELGDELTNEEAVGIMSDVSVSSDTARPTRDQFTESSATTVVADVSPLFTFTDSDGACHDYEAQDFLDAFAKALAAAGSEAEVEGLWETNSSLLPDIREIDPDLAQAAHDAYSEALDRVHVNGGGRRQPAHASTLEVPLKDSGVKDYATFCRILADRLKEAGDIDTFNAWQTMNEREMAEAEKTVPRAYASLMAAIDTKGAELLSGEG